jgi:hypothetical protein
MPEVVFDSWLFDIYLASKFFVNIPFHEGAHIPCSLSKTFGMQAYEHKQIECSLYFALHGISQMSTPNLYLRKGIWWVLEMNGMGLWNPSHD